jgi:hypothetical protein
LTVDLDTHCVQPSQGAMASDEQAAVLGWHEAYRPVQAGIGEEMAPQFLSARVRAHHKCVEIFPQSQKRIDALANDGIATEEEAVALRIDS